MRPFEREIPAEIDHLSAPRRWHQGICLHVCLLCPIEAPFWQAGLLLCASRSEATGVG